jgi:hypothetical protein
VIRDIDLTASVGVAERPTSDGKTELYFPNPEENRAFVLYVKKVMANSNLG